MLNKLDRPGARPMRTVFDLFDTSSHLIYVLGPKIERILRWAGRPEEVVCWCSSPLQGAKRSSRPGHGVVTLARPSHATMLLGSHA